MDPTNYTSAFADLQPPGDALMQGYKGGVMIQQVQQQQAAAEAARAQQQQMQQDLAALSQNPTTEAISRLSIKYPQLSENFKRTFDMLDPAQKQEKLSHASQVYAAINNGRPEIAKDLLTRQAVAYRNSGNEGEAKASDTWAQLILEHPETAKANAGILLSSIMGDKFATTFPALAAEQRAQDQAAGALSKVNADARKATADAAVAEGTIPALIEKPKQENLSAEAARRVADLNVQIAQANSETERGRLTLERDKLLATQGTAATEKGEAAQAQVDSAQIALDNIRSLRTHPLMEDRTGNSIAGVGTIMGKMLAAIPGTENMDFRGQLESLKSQVFLPAVQQVKGMGALSNAEGEKLTAAVAALNADMSPPALKNALGVVEKYMTKGLQKGLASKSVPVQGGGFVINHPTFGAVNEGDINRLMKQYPGSTREQVMLFIQGPK